MDSHQVLPNCNTSKKKQKHKSSVKVEAKSTELVSSASEGAQSSHEGSKLQSQLGKSISGPTALSAPALNSNLEEPGKNSSKRKRNRKKKGKKQDVEEECLEPDKHELDSLPDPESVVSISASFIPVVQEAIRLLHSSQEQMNSSETSCTSENSNLKASKKSNKKKKLDNSCSTELETVVSPGAKKLTSQETTLSSPAEAKIFGENASQIKFFGSEDLKLLQSASTLGPIYSRSSFAGSVTVTSSSLSSQQSSERLINSHLYGGVLHSLNCEASPSVTTTTSEKMSAPATGEKSRAEIEAERKARKAAKAAAKGKGKTSGQQESAPSPTQPVKNVTKEEKTAPKIATVNSNDVKAPIQKESVKNLADSMKNLKISDNVKQAPVGRSCDEPDFAISARQSFSLSVEETIPKSLQHLMSKVASGQKESIEKKESGEKKDNGEKKEGSEKSKAELRAERRAKQEAQRAAKVQQLEKQAKQQQQPKPSQAPSKPQQKDIKVKEEGKTGTSSKIALAKDTKAERRVKLFSHLYQNSFKNISQTIGVSHPQYHSSIIRLGVQYAKRIILGSNARCLALLYTLKDLIADYETPPQKEFSRGLEAYLQVNMDFLQQCRPHSVSMVNALRYIKWQISQLPALYQSQINNINTKSTSVEDIDAMAREEILTAVDQYIDDQIGKAAEAIGKVVKDKIDDNDVILVYACSSLVLGALKVALDEKRKFHVIVVDSLPWLEGKEMLRRLVSMGVQCSYVYLSAASFVMRKVSKVLLGAHALLANGYVMSRAGSSQIALLAHAYNVPVLVCCETHKFSERVQTDSFVYNELADPDELIGSRRAAERETVQERPLANWRDIPSLSLLNLVYDVTSPDLVTAVVTERAILPCTSVPVILRMKPTEC